MSELLSIAYEIICKILSTAVFLGSGVIFIDAITSIISRVVAGKRDSKQREELRQKAIKEKRERSEGEMYRRLWAAERRAA